MWFNFGLGREFTLALGDFSWEINFKETHIVIQGKAWVSNQDDFESNRVEGLKTNLVPRSSGWCLPLLGLTQELHEAGDVCYGGDESKTELKKQNKNSFTCASFDHSWERYNVLQNYTKDLDFNEANPPFPINLQWIRQRTIVSQPLSSESLCI